MISYRVIPVLLLHEKGLVKTTKFKKPIYVGDPINAIKIFNEKEVDELVFLDIDASKKNRGPDFSLLEQIASECFMPLGYGGGISTIEQVNRIFNIGIEKVIFNSSALSNPKLISEVAKTAGNQSVVVSIDVKKNWLGKKIIYSHSGTKVPKLSLTEFARKMQEFGAGEIIINAVDQDGMMNGYDLELIKEVAEAVEIPVVACGGASNIQNLREAVAMGKASAVAAGSLFVFYGPHKAVLINYPSQDKLKSVFEHESRTNNL
ncbi:MAG: putative imidazole glycerol phosphate synthase subunit hisF2 [Saprospiraceae bacterium]|nr:MAG: putative imidazole glycerol phosphate synthase subunit hisF2 [Saprospiraceae bacterium]